MAILSGLAWHEFSGFRTVSRQTVQRLYGHRLTRFWYGEETVQTTNAIAAAKAEVG